jgi:hypothetical protein
MPIWREPRYWRDAFTRARQQSIGRERARCIAGEVGLAVSAWEAAAGCLDLSAREIRRMASAFEHADLRQAQTMSNSAPDDSPSV